MTAALWTPEPSNDKVRQVPPRPTRGRGVGESRALTVPPSPCRDGATQLMPGPWTRTSSSPPSSDSRICCILEPLHYLTQESALEGGRALLPLPEPRPLPAPRSRPVSVLVRRLSQRNRRPTPPDQRHPRGSPPPARPLHLGGHPLLRPGDTTSLPLWCTPRRGDSGWEEHRILVSAAKVHINRRSSVSPDSGIFPYIEKC